MRESAAGRRRPRLVIVVLVGGLAAAVAGPTGWFVTDALERDNDFCNACHLSEGVPLHRDIRTDFDARPPDSLASLHAKSGVHGRAVAPDFLCIDCHGGVGFLGRARVKLLAGKDAFWYVVGYFEEPVAMAWPLEEADCRQCHEAFAVKAGEFEAPAFHDLSVHNRELGVTCVECHQSHETHGDPGHYFLEATRTRRQCARCHSDFVEVARLGEGAR